MSLSQFLGEISLGETRKCNYCEKVLPLNMFHNGTSCYRTQCKTCAKLATKNLQEAKRNAGNPSPPPLGTPCVFCGKFRGKKLTFEHNHDTKEFRGWTCDPCNRGLGILERSLETSDLNIVANKILQYVEKRVNNRENLYRR